MVIDSSKFDTEKCLVFVWSVVTTILSLVGNCAVLVATIKYNAIKIDNISKVIFSIHLQIRYSRQLHLFPFICSLNLFVLQFF